MNKKIYIVTGANGFLGNNIVRKLLNNNEEVRALVLPDADLSSLKGLNCKIYNGDVTKLETLKEIFMIDTNCKLIVIHCAAIVYIKSKYDQMVYDVNVNGTKNIVKKVLESNAKLVYVSSVHAITEKKNKALITEIKDFDKEKVKGLYAKTKAETAKYVLKMVQEKNLNACIVHPSGIIGPNDYGNTHLTQLILDYTNHKLKACVRGGYDFVDVRDVSDGVIKACIQGEKGECYILSNTYITIKDLLDKISKIENIKPIKFIIPMFIAKLTAPLSELYYKILNQPPLYTSYSLYTLTSNANFSNAKAKEKLGYTTTNIDITLKDTVDWLRKQGRIK